MTDPFALLGLDRATATEAAVKASYATLLKKTRPEDDRAAFMALRDAFTAARAIAKGRDAHLAAEPAMPAPATETATPEPAPPPPQPVQWTLNEQIAWNVADTPLGALVGDTLVWMIEGGPDSDRFAANVAERLLSDPTIEEAAFHEGIIEYIVAKADVNCERDYIAAWETLDLEPPPWLNETLMRVLAHDLRLFRHRPVRSWAARDYNIALNLFAPVLETVKAVDEPAPIDVATLFADEQDATPKDAHGSFFDRETMTWTDLSPVAIAVRDINLAIEQAADDLPDQVEAILNRDELQAIDEFQDIDTRLRHLICNATGWHGQTPVPVYPAWLTPTLLLLLDDTFGWSRHHGRPGWERHQFAWLHGLIARDRTPQRDQLTFRAAQQTEMFPPQPAPAKPSLFWDLLALIAKKPIWILVIYLLYRIVQAGIRLGSL